MILVLNLPGTYTIITMEIARSLSADQSKLLRQNTDDIRTALRDAAVYRDRRTFGRLMQQVFAGEVSRLVARFLVCCYYLNLVFTEIETWTQLRTVEAQLSMLRWREPGENIRPLPFPAFQATVVLPAALLTALGVVPWLFGTVLLLHVIWRDARLTWVMIMNVVAHRSQPTELLMKQLALIGSTLLAVVLSVRESRQFNRAAAGVLQSDTPRRHALGVKRSSLLLVGRLMMAGLMMFAGYRQAHRIHQRWTSEPLQQMQHHYGRPDARDNNWLLLQCALALPLALGLWTVHVSLLLCCALLGEAVMHWQWWQKDTPSWHYRQNTRDHFFVNVAVAGGLALMQSFGGGVLTVDQLLHKKK